MCELKLASYPLRSDIGSEGGGGGGDGRMGAPAEILPPKRQAVFERLRRRIESYRRHQNDCIPRFDHSFNGVVEQNIQDTLLLKQRFLENKAKRGIKKSDKKPLEGALPKFPSKRSATEDVEINGENFSDQPPNKGQPSNQKLQNMTKFSVEIVQQLEFTTTSSNSQISTNVTVKAMNTSVKSDVPQSPKPSTPMNPEIIECKQEPESLDFVDLEQCAAALEKDAAANGGSSFPGFSDLIGDDTSDAIITSDAFKDLISEISDFNPEFMRDFDFDGGDAKTQPAEAEVKNENIKKSQMPSNICPPNKLPFNSGLDFKAELSPAAQTLKQMAEQHQHKAQMGMVFTPSRPNSNQFQYVNNDFNNSHNNSHNQSINQNNFKQGVTTPPSTMSFTSDTIKQEVFSGQNSPIAFSPGRKIPSPSQVRMSAPYNQQFPNYSSPNGKGGPSFPGGGGPNPQSSGGQQQQKSQQPPRPSSSGASIQANQSQQMQAQGKVQVSLAQSLNGEVKGGPQGVMSLGAQQGVFLNSVHPNSYCSVSQSQSINFNQQTFRQRAPSKPPQNQNPHHQIMDMMGPGGQSMPSQPDYTKVPGHMPSHPGVRFPQRMVFQSMPPSGPMLRVSQAPFGLSGMPLAQPRAGFGPSNGSRHLAICEPSNWRPMFPNQSQRPQFVQAQGVSYSSSENQLSAAQLQHSSVPHPQALGIHHVNPTMSVRIQMSQNMGGESLFTTSEPRPLNHRPSAGPNPSTASYSSTNVTNSYTQVQTHSYEQPPQQLQHMNHQHHHSSHHPHNHSSYQQNGIPQDFCLDFFEQFPQGDNSSFNDQEFLNTLDSGGSFNFPDIL